MRLEVRYPNGALHEVELEGTLAVVGRDPSCDLVLNDAKCSRRHAVIEAGADGLLVRDSGSANGVYVNGKKTERASVQQGDEIRLGEVVLKVLPEEVAGTLVMGPDELPDAVAGVAVSSNADTVPPSAGAPVALPPAPKVVETPATPRPSVASPPPPAPPAPAPPAPALPRLPTPPAPAPAAPPAAPPRRAEPLPRAPAPPRPPSRAPRGGGGPVEPLPRPLTGMLLAALWLLAALSYLATTAILVWTMRSRGLSPAWPAISLMLAMVSVTVGVGLWMRAPWARLLQIATAGIGLLTCIYTPLSAAALAYMLRGASRIHFSGRDSFSELTAAEAAIVRSDSGDGLFMAGVLVGLLVTLVLAGVAVALGLPALGRP